MKKENMVNLVINREMKHEESAAKGTKASSMSDELQKAIQTLIYRMRELGPIQTV